MPKILLTIPCYNEAARLDPARFLEAARGPAGISFLFVDDGSADATPAILAELGREEPAKISSHRLPVRRGKAEAVRRGMLLALERPVDFAGYWDADLSTPLAEAPAMVGELERRGADVVLGSRVQLLGRRIERRTVRHYLGRAFATASSLVLGLPVYDTQCGAKIFRRTPDTSRVFGAPFTSGWVFDVEILARLRALGRGGAARPLEELAVEYPLERWCDIPGSKVRARDFFVSFAQLARILLRYRGPGAAARARRLLGD